MGKQQRDIHLWIKEIFSEKVMHSESGRMSRNHPRERRRGMGAHSRQRGAGAQTQW